MKKILLLAFVVSVSCSLFAQGVKIGAVEGNPDGSAILDLESSSKGLLPPRMTTAERNAIVDPATGLQIFNTTTNCVNIWTGSTWKQVCGDCDFNSPIAGNNGPICEGSTLNLSATSILGAVYQWTGPNGFSSNLQNPTIPNATPGASGSYSVSATLNGCTSQLQNTVATVNSTPVTPTAGNDGPTCVGAVLNLSAATINGASYNWTGPNGYSANVQNPVLSSAQVNNAGVYNVTATVNGCISAAGTTSVSINSIPATPGAISGPSEACPDDGGNVYTISSVPAATSYNWGVPAGASISSNTGTSVTVTYGTSPVGNITVSATNVCGSSSASTFAVTLSSICSPMTFNATGTGRLGTIQSFTVPEGITSLTIEAWGAGGGHGDDHCGSNNTMPGKGARMKGTFTVTPGQTLKILVGQQGKSILDNYTCSSAGGGGGGGTFVTLSDNTPLIVAGGGGGENWDNFNVNGVDAMTTNIGSGGGSTSGRGGAGGGLNADGVDYDSNSRGGQAFINGGNGGIGQTNEGGFGGGGGSLYEGGGGGGYSGGNVITTNSYSGSAPTAAGSYNSGTNQSNSGGVETGNGHVVLTW